MSHLLTKVDYYGSPSTSDFPSPFTFTTMSFSQTIQSTYIIHPRHSLTSTHSPYTHTLLFWWYCCVLPLDPLNTSSRVVFRDKLDYPRSQVHISSSIKRLTTMNVHLFPYPSFHRGYFTCRAF